MQTFLPFADYAASAAVLDQKRLGKQRVECLQILNALTRPDYGWQNHPAVKMWRNHVQHLVDYSVAICDEWISRGYRDTCRDKILVFRADRPGPLSIPEWITPELCRSHQSNLVRKKPDFYEAKFPGVPADLEYVWP